MRARAGRRRPARRVSRDYERCRVRTGRTRPYRGSELLDWQAARPDPVRRPARRLRQPAGEFASLDCRRRDFHVSAMTRTAPAAAHSRHQHHVVRGGGRGDRSRLRHERRSGDGAPSRRTRRPRLFLLRRALPRAVRRRARALSRRQAGTPAGSGGRGPVDLPDASRDRARRPGKLPDLRHGAGADDPGRRRRGQSRAGRHVAALLGRRRAVGAAAGRWRWASTLSRAGIRR